VIGGNPRRLSPLDMFLRVTGHTAARAARPPRYLCNARGEIWSKVPREGALAADLPARVDTPEDRKWLEDTPFGKILDGLIRMITSVSCHDGGTAA